MDRASYAILIEICVYVCVAGDWVRRDSGVGAGIDSYYEYLLKAYVLLGDEGYLERFNKVSALICKEILVSI